MLPLLLAAAIGPFWFILGWYGHKLYLRQKYRFTRKNILRYHTRINSRRAVKTLRQLRRKTSLVRKADHALNLDALFEVGPSGF